MAGWDMGVQWEDVWEFLGQFYRGTVQSQGILYNPMGHRGLMGLMGSLMANLNMTDSALAEQVCKSVGFVPRYNPLAYP